MLSSSRIHRFAILLSAALAFLSPHAAFAADEKPTDLPVKRVVIFNSGVSFYEHTGEIEGNAKVDMRFRVANVNDLLKSMVLQDLGGGRISTVSYGSKDPITRTLQTFSINLTENPTLADLLTQVRGETVEVEAPAKITGVIVGLEKRERPAGKDEKIEVDYINLLTEEGLRSLPLESIGKIKFTNAKLDAEFRQALAVLATSHDVDKKTVSLNFLGAGKRAVRVGYVQESPVWKTSYRLVLAEKDPPLLQGWAIVENTTEADWNGVNLTLMSGRPISFIMDLYEPLYVNRPEVQMEQYASLRPRTYEQDLGRADDEFKAKADKQLGGAGGGMGGFGGGLQAGRKARELDRAEQAKGAAAPAEGVERQRLIAALDTNAERMNLKEGFQSVAQAGDVGELFQYTIGTPVTLERGRSAMLPIVNESVQGEKLSIYNERVQAKHPLNGLRLKNTTDLHLMQGPMTVFDDGAYAGDAQITDLPPKSERLLSYALDLDTEVAPAAKNEPQQLVSARLAKGVLYTSHKLARSKTFTVKNSGKKAKKVLVEYPLEQPWTLTAPKEPTEKTRDMYRFAVAAEPGKPAELVVQEEQVQNQQVAANNLDSNTVAFYLGQSVVSAEVKAALQEIIKRKAAMGEVLKQRQEAERQIQVIDQEQARIRQNMAQLPKDSDLYRRYITKFTDQETAIEKLREQVTKLAADEAKLRKDLDDYLLGLDLK